MNNVLVEDIDSNDELLDEELEHKINETELELGSIENPQTIGSGFEQLDPKTINDFYENIKKMPRDKFAQLMASMGQSHENLGSDYQFTGMSQNSQKTAKEKLAEKISHMKNKRTSRYALKQQLEKYEEAKKLQQEQQEILSQINNCDLGDLADNDSPESEKSHESTKPLSKGQKKKLRAKAKKNSLLNNNNSNNSNNNEENIEMT